MIARHWCQLLWALAALAAAAAGGEGEDKKPRPPVVPPSAGAGPDSWSGLYDDLELYTEGYNLGVHGGGDGGKLPFNPYAGGYTGAESYDDEYFLPDPAQQLLAECADVPDGTPLNGTGACEVRLSGADEVVSLLAGGLDGIYKPVACHDGRPVYIRQGSQPHEHRVLWWSNKFGDWDIGNGTQPVEDVLAFGGSPAELRPHHVTDWMLASEYQSVDDMGVDYVPANITVECANPSESLGGVAPGGTVVVVPPRASPRPRKQQQQQEQREEDKQQQAEQQQAEQQQGEGTGEGKEQQVGEGGGSRADPEQPSTSGDGSESAPVSEPANREDTSTSAAEPGSGTDGAGTGQAAASGGSGGGAVSQQSIAGPSGGDEQSSDSGSSDDELGGLDAGNLEEGDGDSDEGAAERLLWRESLSGREAKAAAARELRGPLLSNEEIEAQYRMVYQRAQQSARAAQGRTDTLLGALFIVAAVTVVGLPIAIVRRRHAKKNGSAASSGPAYVALSQAIRSRRAAGRPEE